ncbi:uncharacterized protein LOC108032905 isoform X2 [Drosophila biarmipes]|uniref:uncharacterized protein LOC108032905 isoform X2 n=1 Tax=Drosophila biarmipes TaxID=125945 RepID=UPI001CDAA977|nr:uncharacterized protein LOC108032905 isoform X2 [Drosophila biarmipes]
MDFIASIMKRPKSIATTGITSTQATAMEASKEEHPFSKHSGTATTQPAATETQEAEHPSHLGTLLESAAEDLLQLEEQHCSLLNETISIPLAAAENSSSRETIQQLLSEINVNLNQVSANEMEHLQAMSGEISPLSVKPSHKPSSMDQQKALAAAIGHQTVVTGCPKLDVDAVPKFGGLPEFDETQIPELAPLSAEMEAQTKSNHSDSDVFVECLLLHSERYTGDRSELEAYSSALNDVLEQQLSMTSAATLENEFEDPLAVSQHNNVSYEAMDVDDINETMEMLKDVLDAEDHELLQQKILCKTQPVLDMNLMEGQGKQEQERIEGSSVPQKQLDTKQEFQSRKEGSPPRASGDSEHDNEASQGIDFDFPSDQKNEEFEKEEETQEKAALETKQESSKEVLHILQAQDHHQDLPLNFEEHSGGISEDARASLGNSHEDPKTSESVDTITRSERTETNLCLEQNASPAVEATEDRLTAEEFEPMEVDVSMKVDDASVIRSPRQKQVETQAPISTTPPLNVFDAKETVLSKQPLQNQYNLNVEPPPAPLSPPIPTPPAKREELAVSPPIPTHRPKTAEELEFLTLRELPLPDDLSSGESSNMKMKVKELEKVGVKEQQKPVVVVTPTQTRSTTPLSLDLGGSITKTCTPEPTSPSFPIRGPAKRPSHFPRSPHALPDLEDMPYLEEAVVEPSLDRKQSVFGAGVIAKSTVAIEVTHPSPEKQGLLNETLPMSEHSPTLLNGTFDSGKVRDAKLEADTAEFEGSPTFAGSLKSVGDNQRRTFSVIQSTAEKEEEKSRGAFCKENPRRTFCLEQNASPAIEATEDIVAGEVMDVDVSMRMDEVTVIKSPQKNWKESQAPVLNSPPIPTYQNLKRPAIHEKHSPVSPPGNATVVLEEQTLSAKEQATLCASDEKDDVFIEHFGAISPVSDDMFKTPQFTSSGFNNQAKIKASSAGETGKAVGEEGPVLDAEFRDGASNQNLILNSSDFDYLYTKGSNNAPIDRSSLLLKFDPLLGAPVPVNHLNQQEQALLNILGANQNRILSPTLEEHETSGGNQSFGVVSSAKDTAKKLDFKPPVDRTKKHVKMSVDVIDNDCNKTFDNSNLNTEDKNINYNNMDELEKKIKNEVTRSEDIEKKLKEGEQREEALIKRITEKDKINAKLNGVIEAYEKAIAELISEKEQQAQLHERQLQEVQADRDANYHHLTSLETTFSDLHVKYEKSKEMTTQLKNNEESLLAERRQMMDNLRLQEQRYDKMKNHAMQQLEMANKKLDTYAREHADESKKLKALLKKEEISRVSMTEQLQQKSRENADLLKICEELIYGKGQDF